MSRFIAIAAVLFFIVSSACAENGESIPTPTLIPSPSPIVNGKEDRWNQMSLLYNTGDKEKMKQSMDENKSFFPTMIFFGVMDMMMFSMMFSMMGMAMTDYVPRENIPEGEGVDDGDTSADDGGFDFDVGF